MSFFGERYKSEDDLPCKFYWNIIVRIYDVPIRLEFPLVLPSNSPREGDGGDLGFQFNGH